MRVCGVVCEYNPFHNGHAYHLAKARALAQADYLICVMSGSFTQRGEPALVDKWSRARMALLAGADLVLEMPALFAVRAAENFALGGVAMLHALGADALAFGSEYPDLVGLQTAAKLLESESGAFQEALHAELAHGAAFPRARAKALAGALPQAVLDALAQPNTALAVCYLRALLALGSEMTPVLIPRAGKGYHDPAPGALASATAVRAAVLAERWPVVEEAVPPASFALLREARELGRLHAPQALDTALLAALRLSPPERIAELCGVSEGLEHRIRRAAWASGTREDLLSSVKCKRYTWARLSRILCAALLGLTQSLADRYPLPSYARVLGFRSDARPLLSHLKQTSSLPLITKTATSGMTGDDCFALDLRATDLWVLGCASPAARAARQDFLRSPVIL